MATQYTSLLGLALPVTGELSGTWGDTVNTAITSLLDSAVAGTTTLSADTDVTLTTTTGVANQARQAIILWTANGSVTRNVTAPAQSKIYTVINASAGTQSIVIRGAGPTTGVTIIKGESAQVAWNGSDFIKISNTGGSASFTNVTVSGTTTLSGLTASTALALNGSKEVVSVTNTGTGNNVLSASPTLTGTVAGASLQLSSLTSGRVTYAGASGLLQDSANFTFNGTTATINTLSLTNALATTSGGTGLSSFVANRVFYASSTSAIGQSGNLTFDGNLLTVANLTDSSLTDGRVTYAGAGGNLTDSSSLTFDGTNLGVGTASPDIFGRFYTRTIGFTSGGSTVLQINGGSYGGIDIGAAGTRTFGLTASGTDVNLTTLTNIPILFGVNGSEGMRLTSTGLGIGNSSPTAKLDVTGTAAISGAVTLSGGTANGVAYLNGSKVLTTGSALTFDGTALTNTRNTTDGSAAALTLNNSGTTGSYATLNQNAGPVTYQQFVDAAGNAGVAGMTFRTTSNHPLVWGINSAEQMRLTSTGLGIGTSSPSSPAGFAKVVSLYDASTASYTLNSGGTYKAEFGISSGGGYLGTTTAHPMRFASDGNVNMILDSSGNLGLGVTPSAWGSIFRVQQFGNYGAFVAGRSDAQNQIQMGVNAFFNGTNFVYSNSDVASRYYQISGQHRWDVAPSGTAGNAISFTQAMTLDASGNLGIGTSSPAYKLDVLIGAGSGSLFRAGQSGVSNGYTITSNGSALTHFWATTGEAMRLDSSGNLGIGTSSPQRKLHVNATPGATYGDVARFESNGSAGPVTLSFGDSGTSSALPTIGGNGNSLVFGTGAATQMTLNLAGNLGLGVTPSAWGGSGVRAFDVGSGASFAGSGGDAGMIANAYYNGTNWIYKTSSLAVRYQQLIGTGAHAWFTAPSGTAGNAISFTQAMTLDASGNLLLGETSRAYLSRFTLSYDPASTNGPIFLDSRSFAANRGAYLWLGGKFNTAGAYRPFGGIGAFKENGTDGDSTGYLAFATNGNSTDATERARIDSSGNLGIGTSSPALPLDVVSNSGANAISIRGRAADDIGTLGFYTNAGSNIAQIQLRSDEMRLLAAGARSQTFYTNGSERMRLDSSGNLGLGVTPSAWGSGKAFEIAASGNSLWAGTGFINLTQNVAFTSGAYRYGISATAGRFEIQGNEHRWFTAPSGTAGNAISFTQAMTLDASGRLLVGTTTSGSFKLDVQDAGNTLARIGGSGSGQAGLTLASGAAFNPFLNFLSSVSTVEASIFAVAGSGALVFGTGSAGTERARIDSSGNLLVGTTTASGRVTVVQNSASSTIANFENTENSPTAVGLTVNFSSATGTNNTTAILIQGRSAGAERFYVYGNGNVVNTNNSYGAISDAKLKENIVDATPKLEKLNQVRVVNFNMIGSEQKQIGVIAQELEAVFPAMVEESPDRDTEGNDLGTTTKSVKYSVFVPMLIKAIQEQQAIINQLKARLDAANI